MKRGQISVIYLLMVSLISIFLFGLMFVFSNNMKDAVAIQFNEQHTTNLHSLLEQRLVRMKTVAEPAVGSRANATLVVPIPNKIGDSNYFVRGDDQELVIEIPGKGFARGRQTIFRNKIYWWNTTFEGGASSNNGKVVFFFNASSGNIIIS